MSDVLDLLDGHTLVDDRLIDDRVVVHDWARLVEQHNGLRWRRDVAVDVDVGDVTRLAERPIRPVARRLIKGFNIADTAAAPFGFWWQRRPADVAVVMTPGDPSGTPLAARHPHPADFVIKMPAAIVIGGPTEALI